MSDLDHHRELDRVRALHEVIPGPDDATMARVALMLLSAMASGENGRRRAPWRRKVRAPISYVTALVVTVTVVLLLVVAMLLPVARPAHLVAASHPGVWRLTGYLRSTNWANSPGPFGQLQCPTASKCYVASSATRTVRLTARSSAILAGHADTLFVSDDLGASWTRQKLPADLIFAFGGGALNCASAVHCSAIGTSWPLRPASEHVRSSPAPYPQFLLSTDDGGRRWTSRRAPSVVQWTDLSCPTTSFCIASGAALPRTKDGEPTGYLAVTTDGGRHWTTRKVPDNHGLSLDCPSAALCLAVGARTNRATRAFTPLVLRTTDRGASWMTGKSERAGTSVTCAGNADCWLLGEDGVGLHCHDYGSCRISTSGYAPTSDIEVSRNGGITWSSQPLPPGVVNPILNAISCPTPENCWAAGGNGVGGNSQEPNPPIILRTSNGGRSWLVVGFHPVLSAGDDGNSLAFGVGSLQCPGAATCIAQGELYQGDTRVPLFSNAAPPG